jgi:hypothetical protein
VSRESKSLAAHDLTKLVWAVDAVIGKKLWDLRKPLLGRNKLGSIRIFVFVGYLLLSVDL